MTPTENFRSGPVHLVADIKTGDRFLLYATEKGVHVELRYEGDALWMNQAQMSELFGVSVPTINEHIRNIYAEGELDEEPTIRNFRIVRSEGTRSVTRDVKHYGLDTIISVGYRVGSTKGTLFRKWATEKLVQFATKGFVVDVERLKNPDSRDHFAELREIIRDIRASEANLYKEVRAICALCSDYPAIPEKQRITFFAAVQNKLHYAVTGMTGAEIRVERADAAKSNMGLMTWSGDHPTQIDSHTAKNFLGEAEIRDLNRFTSMLLDYFEQETELERLVTMADAEAKLYTFVRNNERPLLRGKGRVSKAAADRHVKMQYKIFNEERRRIRHKQADSALEELKKHDRALPEGPKRKGKRKGVAD